VQKHRVICVFLEFATFWSVTKVAGVTKDAPYSLGSALREIAAGTAWRTRKTVPRLARFWARFQPKGEVVTALFEDSGPRSRAVSRKEATRLLRQVTTGVGALLLAAVDDWNALAERHPAHLRTELHGLLRGSHVAALTAASTWVWLSSHGMHPPGHTVSKPHRWSMISSHGKTYLAIHHNEMEPTNPRRTAFCNQDSETLRLIDSETTGLLSNPTHCEITWDYDTYTDAHIRRMWVSAPGVDWGRFEIPMAKAQAQLAAWRKRKMKWLPGELPTSDHAVEPLPARDEQLRPGIEVRPPERSKDVGDTQ
jgi:hypothetical protein